MVATQVVVGVVVVVVVAMSTPAHGHAGSCEDHTQQCPQWAAAGYCQVRKHFMLLNCPVSCNVCLDPDCFDRSRRCSELASRGHCTTQPKFMLSTCPHSCDNCKLGLPQTPTTRRRTIANPDFECGRGPSSAGARGGSRQGQGIVNLRTARQIVFPTDPEYVSFPISARTRGPATSGVVPIPEVQNPATPSTRLMMTPGKVEMAAPMGVSSINVDDTFCGATPISDRFLITAAHCVLDPERPVFTVRLGELDFARDNEENSRPVDYQVSQIIVHPDYKPDTVERYNDVALIQTVETIAFNEFVFPYCLSADRPAPKTVVIGAGFGRVNQTHRSSRLQEAELEVIDTAVCENMYRAEGQEQRLRLTYPELLQGRDIMCAAYPDRAACKGDSGGPLFLTRDGRRYLVGIVGSGVSCRGDGASILPGLYVRVADHIDFIDSVLYDN